MKNNLFKSATLVAALAMTMSGCSNEELANGNNTTPKEGTLVTASMPATGSDTRLVHELAGEDLSVKWKASTGGAQEQFYGLTLRDEKYVFGVRFTQVADMTSGKSADFTGETWYSGFYNAGANFPNEKLYLIYSPQDFTKFEVGGWDIPSHAIPYSLTNQDGTITSLEKFNLMTASAVMPDDVTGDLVFNFQFKHRIAVMRLKGLQGFDPSATEATKVSISGTGLCNAATLTIDFDNFDTTGGITLGSDAAIEVNGTFAINNGVLDDVYICFFPGNADATGTHQITDLKVTATVGSDTYEYNYGADPAVANKVETFAEGKMYTLKDKMMTKQVAADYVEINGLKWAKGNLVADGPNGAKIGTATDGGLFFQFGSLVGWNGNTTITVSPANFDPANEDWLATGKIWQSTTDNVPFTVKDSGSANEKAGLGDPCRYYLKDTWRLPTKEEYAALFNNVTDGSYANSGGWSWDDTAKFATNSTKNLTFPTPGYLNHIDGTPDSSETGYYWSGSTSSLDYFGYFLNFNSAGVYPNNEEMRGDGFTVRCVREK